MVYKMERRISTILLIVLLLSMSLFGLRGSGAERALAEPRPRPLADAAWSANVKVNDDPGTASQGGAAIAVDSSGNAYAVWGDERNDDGDIYFSYRPTGGGWSPNLKVNDDPGTAYQYYPTIAVDSSGNAYAVWEDERSGNYDVYFSYRPVGGSWGTNVKVNDDPGTASQRFPSIAVDSSGNAYAVWEDYRNGDGDIYFAYRPAGGSWSTNVRVNDDPSTADQWAPAIGVDSSGNTYTVWMDERNGDRDIYFAYRPAGGSWSTNVRVNDDPGTAYQYYPAIGVDSLDNAYVVWTDERNGDYDIYFAYRPVGGSWGTNVKVNDDPGTASQYYPAIAVNSSGNAYAVWHDWREGLSDIYFAYRPAGGSWGANVRVDDYQGTAWQGGAAIAVDTSDNAYAIWKDYRNGDADIYFSYRAGAPVLQHNIYLPLILKNY